MADKVRLVAGTELDAAVALALGWRDLEPFGTDCWRGRQPGEDPTTADAWVVPCYSQSEGAAVRALLEVSSVADVEMTITRQDVQIDLRDPGDGDLIDGGDWYTKGFCLACCAAVLRAKGVEFDA